MGSTEGVSSGLVLWIIAKAVIFVIGAIVIGSIVLPSLFKLSFKLRGQGVLLSFSLLVCFLLAYLAGEVGLAPIVGAFAAGLIMEEVQYKDFTDRGEHHVDELIKPISVFFGPLFSLSGWE